MVIEASLGRAELTRLHRWLRSRSSQMIPAQRFRSSFLKICLTEHIECARYGRTTPTPSLGGESVIVREENFTRI